MSGAELFGHFTDHAYAMKNDNDYPKLVTKEFVIDGKKVTTCGETYEIALEHAEYYVRTQAKRKELGLDYIEYPNA